MNMSLWEIFDDCFSIISVVWMPFLPSTGYHSHCPTYNVKTLKEAKCVFAFS